MVREIQGSVRFRGGRWWARVSTADGRRPWVAIEPPITDERAVERARAEARALSALARDAITAPERETLSAWVERWLQARDARGVGSREPRAHLGTHVLPVLGDTPIRAITARDLQRLVQRLDERVSAGTLRWKSAANIWGSVTKAFDDAHRGKVDALRVLDTNPAASVRGPDRGVSTEKVHLYPAEFLALVSCAEIPLVRRRAYAIGVYLYLRPAELEALSWADVDLERGQVQIRRSIDRETGLATSPKAGHARAPHDVEPEILPLLRAMHRERSVGAVVGRLGDERQVAEQLRADLLRAGVRRLELHERSDDPPREWIRMHDLRTTGITWMAVRGDEALTVMARAGHAEIATTLGYVSRAALVRRGYGGTFPRLPPELLSPAPSPLPRITAVSGGNAWESNPRADVVARNGTRNSRGILRSVPPEPAQITPGSSPGDTLGDGAGSWNQARKRTLFRLLEAAKRAISRERGEHARGLIEAAMDALPREPEQTGKGRVGA